MLGGPVADGTVLGSRRAGPEACPALLIPVARQAIIGVHLIHLQEVASGDRARIAGAGHAEQQQACAQRDGASVPASTYRVI